MNQQYQESESIVLDLESLSAKYKNLLIQYKQAVLNYINYLKQESTTPCGKYSLNSNNIDQACYNEIWKKGGCTTKAKKQTSKSGNSSVTLYEWITDTFNWATINDYKHRMGCYGHFDSAYLIIGVGKQDSNLYWREGLNGTWNKINDNSNGSIHSICTGNDGKSIIGVNVNNQIIIKSSWDATNWSAPISCSIGPPSYNQVKFLSIAQGPDGTLVGVGIDQTLWTAPALYNYFWTNVATNTNGNEGEIAVCIGPNGRVIAANGFDIWYKDSYKNLQTQVWKYGCPGCCQDITVAPDGKLIDAGGCYQYNGLNDDQLWAIDSYLNLNGGWRGPYPNSCCIKSVTTVVNTNTKVQYSSATQPNYNIDSQPLTTIKGQAFWGTGPIGSQDPYTGITSLNECSALCSSTANCTGATFNLADRGQPMCWLRTGDANSIPSLANDYAIIPQAKQLLMIVQDINDQLTSVNQEIQKKTNNGEPLYNSQKAQRNFKATALINQFVQLTSERKKIQQLVSKYQSLDQKQESGNLVINQNLYSFYLLLALVIIIIIVLYNFIGSSQQSTIGFIFQSGEGKLGNIAYYIIFGIICIVIYVQFYNGLKHSMV